MVFLIFLLGIIIGLFLNVCIYKLARKQSLTSLYLQCSNCNKYSKRYNIRGKGSYCYEKTYPLFFLVLLVTGILFVLLFYKFHISFPFMIYSFILSLLIIIAFIDIDFKIIPDMLVLSILVGAIVYEFKLSFEYKSFVNLLDSILGLIIGGFLFILIYIFSKGGIGGGDIKLISVLGFILGIPKIFLSIFLSFLLGGVVSIVFLAFRIKKKEDSIPFGPFIVLAFIITFFWGEEIIYWYLLKLWN